MGLIGGLLSLPAAPFRGAGWVLRQVVAEAERQYYDPGAVQRELRELARQLDEGLIGEEEFDRREDELLDRLEAAQEWWAQRPGDEPTEPTEPTNQGEQ